MSLQGNGAHNVLTQGLACHGPSVTVSWYDWHLSFC